MNFDKNHIEFDENVLLITAVLLYPDIIKTICIKDGETKSLLKHNFFEN